MPTRLTARASFLLAVLATTGGCLVPHPPRQTFVPSLIAISVPHLEDAVTWYHDILGFAVEKRSAFPDHHLRLAWLVKDQARLEIIELEGSRPPSEMLPGLDNPALLQGFGKIGFRVTDAARLAAELKRKGVRFQAALRDDAETQTRSFIILDNNGNWLELWEPLGQPFRAPETEMMGIDAGRS